nr:MAG TPA: hypothetical protein [Bacteriophage sp.]
MAVTAFNLGGTKYRTHLSGNVGSNHDLQMTIPNNYNYIVCVATHNNPKQTDINVISGSAETIVPTFYCGHWSGESKAYAAVFKDVKAGTVLTMGSCGSGASVQETIFCFS